MDFAESESLVSRHLVTSSGTYGVADGIAVVLGGMDMDDAPIRFPVDAYLRGYWITYPLAASLRIGRDGFAIETMTFDRKVPRERVTTVVENFGWFNDRYRTVNVHWQERSGGTGSVIVTPAVVTVFGSGPGRYAARLTQIVEAFEERGYPVTRGANGGLDG